MPHGGVRREGGLGSVEQWQALLGAGNVAGKILLPLASGEFIEIFSRRESARPIRPFRSFLRHMPSSHNP